MAVTKLKLLFVILLITSAAVAQDYTVQLKTQRINDSKYKGYVILINGSYETVNEFVYNYVKDRAKLRRKRNFYTIGQFAMRKTKLDSTVVFMKLSEKSAGTQLWLGAKESGQPDERIDEIHQAIQKELVLMARGYYVHRQELKIQEAENAAESISKQQQNLIDHHASLTKKLEDAKTKKLELEAQLEENDLAIKSLTQQLIDNKQAQDSIYIDLLKVNKVIEVQKQKLKEID